MKKLLIVGLGEVGSAIYEIAVEARVYEVYGYDIDPSRSVNDIHEIPESVDYLHICIPFKSLASFINGVSSYTEKFKPKLVIVHSTVAPGTTRAIHDKLGIQVAYSPIRGKHPNLKKHIRFWTKWVSTLPRGILGEVVMHLKELGLKPKPYVGSPETLELAKLWETVYRAIMIAAWQELMRIAKSVGADMIGVMEFVGEVHEVLKDRPIYFPGYIGGHCLIPNTKILQSVFPSKIFEAVIESNEKRRKELEEEEEVRLVKELKRVVLKYVNKEYFRGTELSDSL